MSSQRSLVSASSGFAISIQQFDEKLDIPFKKQKSI